MLLIAETENENEQKKHSLIRTSATTLFIIGFTYWIFPGIIPFGFFEFWRLDNNLIFNGIKSSWPIFCWCVVVTLVIHTFTTNSRIVNRNAEDLLKGGFVISLFAGIVEEILFRWIFFFGAIVGVKLSNFLFFGWLGFGIPEWFYNTVVAPVNNFFTLGKISGILYNPLGWFLGSAVIIANVKFRDGHKYLGWFGYINSWFIGIFLFWILFEYGLPACIAVHFIYDMLIFIVRYVDAAIERARGL